jgi:hypothetical protein
MKPLKKVTKTVLCLMAGAMLFSSCATIAGGSKYYAHVTVNKYPHASIYYKNELKGYGSAAFKVPRPEANAFSVTVKQENCEDQSFKFTERSFRGWAFAGTIVTWTGVIQGIPLPWGVVVDLSTGALWKPDIMEKGVSKIDYKNFGYFIEYTGCKYIENQVETLPPAKTKYERLSELKDLLDKGALSQEEFEKEKKKILDETE